MSSIIVVGLSHKTADVEIREKLAFSENNINEALLNMYNFPYIKECVILSTCNRTEFYATVDKSQNITEVIFNYINTIFPIDNMNKEELFYVYHGKDAIRHLFRVACGLESLVLGEGQILGQVKSAYQAALTTGTSHKVLNTYFKYALTAGKRVRTETEIAQKAVSTSSAAVELAKMELGDLEGKSVLLVGAGKIGEVTLKHLQNEGLGHIGIINRSEAKAEELAQKYNGEAVSFARMFEYMAKSDLVIVGTASPHYLITKDNFETFITNREDKPLLLIDISVPRNIDPQVGTIPNVKVYDIDDLSLVVEKNKQRRNGLIHDCMIIIEDELTKAHDNIASNNIIPTIADFRGYFETVLDEYISGHNLSEAEKKHITAFLNKALHTPIKQLKSIDSEYEEQFVTVIRHLIAGHQGHHTRHKVQK